MNEADGPVGSLGRQARIWVLASTRGVDVRGGLEAIQAASSELSRLQDVGEILDVALNLALDLTGAAVAFIRLADEAGPDQLRTRVLGSSEDTSSENVERLITRTALAERGVISGGRKELKISGARVLFLEAGGKQLGLIGVGSASAVTATQESTLAILAGHVAGALQVARLQQRRREMVAALVNMRTELDHSEQQRLKNEERVASTERVERAHELAVAALLAVSVHARSGHNLADFYKRLTASIAELVEADKVLFWELGADGMLVALAGSYGVDADFVSRLYPTRAQPDHDDLASRVVFHDHVFRASRSDHEGDFTFVLDALGVNDAISVPWRAGDERLGIVAAYDSRRPEGFTREDTWVLQKVGLAAGLVWQLKHAEMDLQKTVERLQKVNAARQLLLKNVSTAVDKASKRFAAELHDDALQKLTGAELHLRRLRDLSERDASSLAEANSLLAQTEDALRRLLFEVRPPALDNPGGLEESIRERVAMVRSLTDAEIELEVDLDTELPFELKSTVFRQVAEALTNIEKHAGATRVQVSVKHADGAVHGLIVDNGRGFVVAERNNVPGHLGLLSLRERAILAGGSYRIESEPGIGTTIEFTLPTA